MTTPLPAAAAAMTKDRAAEVLTQLMRRCYNLTGVSLHDAGIYYAALDRALDTLALTAPAGVPDGFVLYPTHGLPELAAALERADRKGYMPDAISEAWAAFDWRSDLAAAPPSDAPGEAGRAQRGDELCANCRFTYDGHISNTGCMYPCWKPSGKFKDPSPAEQGAREAMERAVRRLDPANDLRRFLDTQPAPLAAGRVGVTEQMVMWARDYLLESGVNVSEFDVRCALENALRAMALAGPVVAGEVAKCQHVNDVIGADRMRFCNVCGEQKGYADTAKGNGNG